MIPRPSYIVEKMKWNGSPQGKGEFANKKTTTIAKDGTSYQETKPLCLKCGKNRNGECIFGKSVCFGCKAPGHNTKEYPKCNKKEMKKNGNVRVFAMIQNEEDAMQDDRYVDNFYSIFSYVGYNCWT